MKALLAAILVTALSTAAASDFPKNKPQITEHQLEYVGQALSRYMTDCGDLPAPDRLSNELNASSRSCSKPPYVAGNDHLIDEWGHELVYNPAPMAPTQPFQLRSAGADGVPGTEDDIVLGDAAQPWRHVYAAQRKRSELFWSALPWASIALIPIALVSFVFIARRRSRDKQAAAN